MIAFYSRFNHLPTFWHHHNLCANAHAHTHTHTHTHTYTRMHFASTVSRISAFDSYKETELLLDINSDIYKLPVRTKY